MKKALCVGISHFQDPYVRALEGCTNDVCLMASMLKRHFGFTTAGIRSLTDEGATRTAILKELEWLVEDAAQGDVLVFTLSTHGTWMFERNEEGYPKMKPGGFDKIYMTYDYCNNYKNPNGLLDKEVGAVLDKIPRGVNCYCIIDTCHSGLPSEMKYDASDQFSAHCYPSSVGERDRYIIQVNERLGRDPHYKEVNRVVVTGCADRELSYDIPTEEGKHGLLALSLYQALERHSWNVAVDTVYQEVRNTVRTMANFMDVTQTPQLYGRRRLMKNIIFS